MTISGMAARKLIAGCLAMVLAAPMSTISAYAQQAVAPGEPIQDGALAQAQSAPAPVQPAPVQPAPVENDALAQAQNAPAPAQDSVPAQAPAPASTQDGQGANGQNGAAPAVGTAAAPAETNAGVAASRPEGAVIAPGKQRRVRAILIKVSILVAAGVAVGTVVALSHGSSSQPR
jgi:hypothetical protein